jgi:hypothetical protein
MDRSHLPTKLCEAVEGLLAEDLAICDAISMELLAGARDERWADVEVLHADADFATLACHPDLRVDEVSLH